MNTRILDNVNIDRTYITEDICIRYEANYDYLDVDIIVFKEREDMKHMSYGINGINYYDKETSRTIQIDKDAISVSSDIVINHFDNIKVQREKEDNSLVESITQDGVRREFLNIEGSAITFGKDFLVKIENFQVQSVNLQSADVQNIVVQDSFTIPVIVVEALDELVDLKQLNKSPTTGGIRILKYKSSPEPKDRHKLFQYYENFWKPINSFMCVINANDGIVLNKTGDYGCQTGEFTTDLSKYETDGTIIVYHPRIQSEAFTNITINNKLTIYKNFNIRLSEYAEIRDGEIEIMILQDNGHVYTSTEIPPILSVEFWIF